VPRPWLQGLVARAGQQAKRPRGPGLASPIQLPKWPNQPGRHGVAHTHARRGHHACGRQGGRRELNGVTGKASGKEKSMRAHRGDGSTRAEKRGQTQRRLTTVRDLRWPAVDVGNSCK
jgi:hypothetical protein